jgi:hypothetical protein
MKQESFQALDFFDTKVPSVDKFDPAVLEAVRSNYVPFSQFGTFTGVKDKDGNFHVLRYVPARI